MKANKVLLISSILFLLSGCSYINIDEINGYSYIDSNLYSIGDFTYDASSISKINLCWIAGNVTVLKTASATNAAVSESGSADLNDQQKMHYLIQGSTLYIQYCESLYSGIIPSESKSLTLTIPENIGFYSDLVSSSLTFSADALSLKSLNINTVSGQIIGSESLEVADSINIDSTSGSINLTDVSCPEIEANSVSSDFAISVLSNDKLNVNTVSGSAFISLLDNLGATIDFSTVSGHFSCTKKNIVSDYKTIVGDEHSQISFASVSGNLDIR